MRRSILNGDLVGGTKLSLVEIASTFDVSTTPVREAMRELSFEGLVTIDSYRGGVVTAVTKPEVEEIVRIRQVLEPIAAREAVAGMTSRDPGRGAGDPRRDGSLGLLGRLGAGQPGIPRKIYEASPPGEDWFR